MTTKQRQDHEPSREYIEEQKRIIREQNLQAMRERNPHKPMEVGGIHECRVGTGE